MTVLGYDRFCMQGGDWGAFVASVMALRFPQRLTGIHLNLLGGEARAEERSDPRGGGL